MICRVCKIEKEETEFPIRSSTKKPRKECKVCTIIWKKEHYKKNKIKIIEKQKEYVRLNRKVVLKRKKEYYDINKEKLAEKHKIYYNNNKEQEIKRAIEWNRKNKKRRKKTSQKYAKKNAHKINARTAFRRAKKLKATPNWLTKQQKKEIILVYKKAKEMSNFYKKIFHVDHIVPLQGKEVSGLHVPWNLRIILAEENIKKGNRLI